VSSALGMGMAATIVLLCSNIVISALRNVIPDKVRIPCYIVLIAGFVTMIQMLVKAFAPALDKSLGIYLPLIVVNCIILGRAEMFANKNNVIDSALDALGMGLGFTLALFLMATIREVLGNGTWLGIEIPVLADNHISIMTMAPGGFLVFGILIAIVNKVLGQKNAKKEFGCANCPSAEICSKASCESKEAEQ
jgi:electron transport complex protein RnfE